MAPEWFCKIVANKISFNGFIQRLLDYSMIKAREGTDSYSMHPVVQDWCHEDLNRDQNDEFIFGALASIFGPALLTISIGYNAPNI